ncbi:hypothetical protein Poly59_58300 [Rubripirellula reticaptiva]|uniref:Uncharacterized protein n=1 Tax=Rubripirellula reticaptiva TaxID=2528013 RepID=A0A5C6EFN0_9BACT|nr:hypothetical protein Poly59_58300 [Rubripirellula reticaptiva]
MDDIVSSKQLACIESESEMPSSVSKRLKVRHSILGT